jgi:hypothetical protein
MQMDFIFWRGSNEPAHKTKCRIIGNPLGAILAISAVMYVAGFAWCVTKYLRDSYFSYEGEVVAIARSWIDWLVLEGNDQEHMIIRTPAGDTIDRVVSIQTRSLQRIEVGDYVVKSRGIRRKVRPRDKMTTQEIRQMALEQMQTGTPNRTPAGGRQKAPPEE